VPAFQDPPPCFGNARRDLLNTSEQAWRGTAKAYLRGRVLLAHTDQILSDLWELLDPEVEQVDMSQLYYILAASCHDSETEL
jgi:hypothetical protein